MNHIPAHSTHGNDGENPDNIVGGATSSVQQTIKEKLDIDIPVLESKETCIGDVTWFSETVQIGNGTRVNTIICSGEGPIESLHYDPRLVKECVATEPSGLLIDIQATEKEWGTPPGKRPEEFITRLQGNSIGICPSNWGWQKGKLLIDKGVLILDGLDRELTGKFDAIVKTQGQWTNTTIEIDKGKICKNDKEKLSHIEVGFSMPLILKNGEVAELGENMKNIRYLADLRNIFDFAAGKKLPPNFWVYLRKLLPSSSSAGKRLLRGGVVVTRGKVAMSDAEVAEFQDIISQNDLTNILKLDTEKTQRLVISKQLPLGRNPLVGVGFDNKGNLIITAIDGRQAGSAGATVIELAQIMKRQGAVTGGLGCAGGDVALIQKVGDTIKTLNTPSVTNKDGKPVTRPVPSMLIVRT